MFDDGDETENRCPILLCATPFLWGIVEQLAIRR
jgi:hypothetical protein